MQHRVARIKRASQSKISDLCLGKSASFENWRDAAKSLIFIANHKICLGDGVR